MGAGFCFPLQLRAAYCHLRHRSASPAPGVGLERGPEVPRQDNRFRLAAGDVLSDVHAASSEARAPPHADRGEGAPPHCGIPLECRYRRDPGHQASDCEDPCLPYHAEARRDDTCQGEGGCTEAGARLGADAPPECRMYQISHLFVYAGLESEGTGAMERDLIEISEMAGMHGILR